MDGIDYSHGPFIPDHQCVSHLANDERNWRSRMVPSGRAFGFVATGLLLFILGDYATPGVLLHLFIGS